MNQSGILRTASAQLSARTSKCKNCKQSFIKRASLQVACSVPCALQLGRIKSLKVESRTDKVRRENLKSRSDLIGEAQIAFNAFIRERDKQAGHACISSGRPLDWSGNAVDAGHYRSRGSAPHLRFDERNCHAQSKHDNRYKSGNAVDYRLGLIKRIGLDAVEALECDQASRDWSHDDLRAIKAAYKLKLKELLEAGK